MAKNVVLIFTDSLNRHFLPMYGNGWVRTPNMDRLAARGVVFEQHHTGSAPCMPARRDLWTGNIEFPWRQWGNCEVFDEHLGRLCAERKVASHLVTDHYHYWERGGGSYMEPFDGVDFIRGHENDYFVSDPCIDIEAVPEEVKARCRGRRQHLLNCSRLASEADYWSPQVFETAGRWLDRNHAHGPFFLAAECFDPHEPFNVPPPYDTMYGPHIPGETYWPAYGPADAHPPEIVERVRRFYAGKVTMLDAWLGRLLDRFDRYGLWDNSTIIFTTDHGHYLGEHNQLGKPVSYPYQTLFHVPLVIHEPDGPEGTRSAALSTHVDVHATIADALGLERKRPCHGRSLLPVVRGEASSVRDRHIMGYWGQVFGCTDGRWKLHQTPRSGNRPLNLYGRELDTAPWAPPVALDGDLEVGDFMPHAGTPVLRVPATAGKGGVGGAFRMDGAPSLLFDLQSDPGEERDLLAALPEEAARMRGLLKAALAEIGAPAEHVERLGL